ncbi:hypothetical protein KKG63_02425 [Patescibacteria group bacterium]|nr:hypothetical protein [Patescibacteria group bacterium]
MDKNSHITHYLVLILGLLTCFFLFMLFRNQPVSQMWVAAAGSVFYSTWGIMHGLLEQRLNRHIAFEYIVLSLFVFALLFISLSLK